MTDEWVNPIPMTWPHGYCPRCDQPLDPAWEACDTCGRDLELEKPGGDLHGEGQ